ncbi:Antitoxin VapB40 [Leucobacter sp. BZR 635]
MITTIDAAGRIVVPKALRDAMGLEPGSKLRVDLIEGKLQIEFAPVRFELSSQGGLPVITSDSGASVPPLTDEMIRTVLEEGRDESTARHM